ncbi:DUF2384 domain-containing protein [Flammeovirga sp. MY04]|uniref:type II RES/Xre toxin-antitoxin system antitoxin n=1 Tax=Flammeovirga sp. MY04 TaxID=1191459 RepID=UPI000806411A|nr:antitoxin Xre/MbcA/ParS toxin-binding domain-containing protein [Flammeovirga sp. MY04]ANQ52832.1 DUF2384 domain-containing protein [Flammeovirga sp. MY04]
MGIDIKKEKFDIKKSIKRARAIRNKKVLWTIRIRDKEYSWSNKIERVALIRDRLPYEAIELLSTRTELSIKEVLSIFELSQITYNKRKRENGLLNGRDSEVVLLLTELLDFGIEVFNNEEAKFNRWLKKANYSLGGMKPITLFDTVTGIQEVRNILNRVEYGNMA